MANILSQEELDALIEEVDRVSAIEFNGAKLFGNNFDFQLGSGSEPSTTLGLRTQQVGSDDLGAYSVHLPYPIQIQIQMVYGLLHGIRTHYGRLALHQRLYHGNSSSVRNRT